MSFPKKQNHEMKIFELSALSKLEAKDFDILDVPILQDSDVILDMIGERARSELFFVESGTHDNHALRYDFTLAVARYYLDMIGDGPILPQLLAASGTVFRNDMTPETSEFKQISFEYIGHEKKNALAMDAECLVMALDLLSSFRFDSLAVEIADIGLSRRVLESMDIPPIREGRLKNALRHPAKFMSLLSPNSYQRQDNLHHLGKLASADSQKVLEDIFSMTGLKHSGLRSMEEIRDRFVKQAEEAQEDMMSPEVSEALQKFYHLECPVVKLCEKIRNITNPLGINVDAHLEYFERRLDLLRKANINMDHLKYGSLLKRKPEYYSGFMFSLEVKYQNETLPIGGGGRYDELFISLGAKDTVLATGCEIRPEAALGQL